MKLLKDYFFAIMFIALSFGSLNSFSQTLTIAGTTQHNDEPLPGVTISMKEKGDVLSRTVSEKNGSFSIKMEYNHDYEIYFEKDGYSIMHAEVYGAVPEEKSHYRIKYEVTIPFYRTNNTDINQKALQKPFTKISFDGKSKFIDDNIYMAQFIKSLEPEVVKPVIVAPKEKKYHIAGKVLHEDETKSPYKLIRITLIDTVDKEIAYTFTNKFGTFSFSNVGISSTSKLKIKLDIQPESGKASVYTINKELVAGPESFTSKEIVLKNTVENKLIQKLITDTYIPFIAGKITVEEKGDKKLLAEKNVYLINEKGETIERAKTNIFGNFLFNKLPPDRDFGISVDVAECQLDASSKVHLYSARDIEIGKRDSIENGKFRFPFLANDVQSYNELLVEDVDLKMDLKGKMVGDNESNPLSNLRILLLDKNYKIIDSATTSKEGGFTFKYLPYANNLILKLADTSDINNYSSIIIYDNAGNVVKYVSLKSGNRFDYKLLQGDVARLATVYVDDPWLNLTGKDFKKPVANNLVIIENIYFDFDKADILEAAMKTLDKAILALKSNPKMKMEISAHSDSKGGDEYNLKLSDKRAKSALNYIISKGIDPQRISAIGFGEKKLLNNCGNKVDCPEEEHAKNRRLEFNIKL